MPISCHRLALRCPCYPCGLRVQNGNPGPVPSARVALRFLQLLCEGVNQDLQYCVRTLQPRSADGSEEAVETIARRVGGRETLWNVCSVGGCWHG